MAEQEHRRSGRTTHVIAVEEIPTGAKSSAFNLAKLSEKINLEKVKFPLEVGLSKNGDIVILPAYANKGNSSSTSSLHHRRGGHHHLPSSRDEWFWIKSIQFAPDCHVQNARICRWQSDAVILQATKQIPAGDELFLWFGEDVLVNDLGIPPYLNPQNIRGGKNYTCHKCGNEFEAPNPLKLHLALSCGTLSVEVLWSRMATVRALPPSSLNLRISTSTCQALAYPFGIIRAPTYLVPPDPLVTGSQSSTNSRILPRPLLLPYTTHITQPNGSKIPRAPNTPAPGISYHHNPALVTNAHAKSLSDQQAQLETIMSNMGRGKNGHHVCVYCGKLYSRKYGLKIHIRTHTGFKPLQCKICHRPFGDPSNLNKHVRLHSDGNTPYRCEICSKVLVRRRDLDRHIRSRHSTIRLPTQLSAIDCSIRQNNETTNHAVSIHSPPHNHIPIHTNTTTMH